jgi:hypothetical protein
MLTLSKQTIDTISNRNKTAGSGFASMLELKRRRVLASALSRPEFAPKESQGCRVHRANAGGAAYRDVDPKAQHEIAVRNFPGRNACPAGPLQTFSEKRHSANRGEK